MAVSIYQGGTFEPIDEGVYETEIISVKEKTEMNNFKHEEQIMLSISFRIAPGQGPMSDRTAVKSFSPALTPNSKLTSLCKAIWGREFTPVELASIKTSDDIVALLTGKKVQIVCMNKTSSKGRVYYDVTNFMKTKSTQLPPAQQAAITPAPTVPVQPQSEPLPWEQPAAVAPLSDTDINKINAELNADADPIMAATAQPKAAR